MTEAESTIVELPGGRIRGFYVDDGQVFRARGVKYATAKRFREPHLIDHWEDVQDCTKPAVITPQLPSRLEAVLGDIQCGRPQSETCLHVSIAAPSSAIHPEQRADQLLPVMVFFHGGAYLTGGGDLECYEGTPLAKHGVIVVNVTHRLGLLGYTKADDIATPNVGVLDQITALKWVQKNISHLGGEAANVTVFGQSAGADSIFAMLLLPEANDLFHRAILQSAPFGERGKSLSERQQMEKRMNDLIAEYIGTEGSNSTHNDLLKSPQITALRAASAYSTGLMAFGPSLSHPPFIGITQAMATLDDVSWIRKPLLISYTRDDGAFFARMDGWLRPILNMPLIGRAAMAFKEWLYTRQIFAWGSQKLFRQVIQSGGSAALVYFSHRFQYELGAAHCIDLPYLLGSWDAWKQAPMLQGPNAKEVLERVGPEVRKLWVAFASGSDLKGRYFEINDSFHFD